MNEAEKKKWKEKYPKGKAFLSWNLSDYLAHDLEPTPVIVQGKTEGSIMDEEEIAEWTREEIQCLSVFGEHYPNKFEEQYRNYLLDLEYLVSLGKISQEELEKLSDKENFNFGQKDR